MQIDLAADACPSPAAVVRDDVAGRSPDPLGFSPSSNQEAGAAGSTAVFSLRALKEQKRASPLPQDGCTRPASMNLAAIEELLDIKKLGKELQDPRWKGSNESIMTQLREHYIWEELDVIRRRCGEEYAGIYVLPSFASIWEWHGVICVRSGLYQHGFFKFKILVPSKYPMAEPKISFLQGQCIPFHPFVDPRTGLVNFRYLLKDANNPSGDWNPRLHRIYVLIKHLKGLFHPNSYDQRLESLPGDSGVTGFQLFNPSFHKDVHKDGETAAAVKAAELNPAATRMLTANMAWWQRNHARVQKVEARLGVKLLTATSQGLSQLHELPFSELHKAPGAEGGEKRRAERREGDRNDKDGRAQLVDEALTLCAQMQDRSINYRMAAHNSILESQDKLNFNDRDFCVRMRSDVSDLEHLLHPIPSSPSFPAMPLSNATPPRWIREEGACVSLASQAPSISLRMRALTRGILAVAGLDPDLPCEEPDMTPSPEKGLVLHADLRPVQAGTADPTY